MTEILGAMEKHFGSLDISRGNEHKLLGMKIKIGRVNKNIVIDMKEQI